MTVKIFVAKDSKGNEWAPDYVQEVGSLEWMLKKAWVEFHHLPSLYCMIANLRQPSADLVIMTERGLGILELKHVQGIITIGKDDIWYAGRTIIHAGIHLNPRRQVQKYAETLRPNLLQRILPPTMKKDPSRWDDLKFQTAVCFSNPEARFEDLQQSIAKRRPSPYLAWESDFSIFGPSDFTSWVRRLRFQVDEGPLRRFEPVRLSPNVIINIAAQAFNAVEWKEILTGMPTGEPYGFLVLEDEEGRQVFSLTKDEISVGRSPDCDIVIPDRYGKVSKKHCRIIRSVANIEINDLNSRNGTYLNNVLLSKNAPISHGDRIFLGSDMSSERPCMLRFETREYTTVLKPKSTEIKSNEID